MHRFFLPTIVKGFGISNFHTGMVTAVPFVFGTAGMLLLTRHSGQDWRAQAACGICIVLTAWRGDVVLFERSRAEDRLLLRQPDRESRRSRRCLDLAGELFGPGTAAAAGLPRSIR